jgi:crotonobetainyl-CoA:carnitine CoA-transferase CaiB-like acyl-CoA transferase
LGAQVIKVESPARPDILRGPVRPHSYADGCYPDDEPSERPYDRHGYYNDRNLGKLGIAVDIRDPAGATIIHDLVAVSDVIVENYAVGVMARLGLGYRRFSAINPSVIYLSMPANGNTGPEARYNGFGITNDLMSGMAKVTGYPGEPQNLGINASDPVAGLHGAAAVLTALWARQATGHGSFIDLSQRESAIRVCFEQIIDFQMNGREPQPRGNRHPTMAPHGCYPCLGEDRWICITVPDDVTWHTLCRAMQHPDLADDERFRTQTGRKLHEDQLNKTIARWTRRWDNRRLMARLQEEGVPAGAVASAPDLMEDTHLLARSFFHEVEHPLAGKRRHPGAGFRMRPPGPVPPRRHAPCFGQDNDYVLREVLRYPPERIQDLKERGLITDAPWEPGERGSEGREGKMARISTKG